MFFPNFDEDVSQVFTATQLLENQYVQISELGNARTICGPCLHFPDGPHEKIGTIAHAKSLAKGDYVRVKDTLTGKITVIKGDYKSNFGGKCYPEFYHDLGLILF